MAKQALLALGVRYFVRDPAHALRYSLFLIHTDESAAKACLLAGLSVLTLSLASCSLSGTQAARTAVSAPTQHTVTLSWSASSAGSDPNPMSGYNVYRGTVSGGPYTKINTALEAATNYVDNTAQSGTTYFYVVTSVDSSGVESAFSNQATAVVPTP